MIDIARVYDHTTPRGPAYLVDRIWPRGVRKADLGSTAWLKDVAPSTELRQWFGHDPARWEDFRRRYFAELDANHEAWRPLAEAARDGDITLLYAAHDHDHNNAVALREYLRAHPAPARAR